MQLSQLIVFLSFLSFLKPVAAGSPQPASQTFRNEVVPILEASCLSCHNDQEASGDFSLERAEDLQEFGYLDLDSPESSYLLELVTPVNGHAEMPKDTRPLTADQIETLRQWIANGAVWPEEVTLSVPAVTDRNWWSLLPIYSPAVPPSGGANPVDAFLERKLSEHRITPVEQAEPQTLLRRLSYDLTGLPPSSQEVNRFQNSLRSNPERAWETVVERYLNSPEFGEKFGQHWLDLVRYAETHGYDKDKPRTNAWPYRDYVIRSFNQDKPYSRFVQEQVAGDALFPNSSDGVLGLGFLAAGPWDFIGHQEVGEAKKDGRIAKHLDRDEMISAVFNVFQSTTVQCAQCHHHKFDPLRMEDYYRLHAVFAAVDRADRVYAGLTTDQHRERQELLARKNALQTEKSQIVAEQRKRIAEQVQPIQQRVAELETAFGAELKPEYGYHSQISSEQVAEKWIQLDLGKPISIREIRLAPAYDEYAGIGAGFGFPQRFHVSVANEPNFEADNNIIRSETEDDFPNPGTRSVLISGPENPVRFVRLTATKLAPRTNDFIFALGEIEVIAAENGNNVAASATVTAKDSIEASPRWGKANVVDRIIHQELTNQAALIEYRELKRQLEIIEAESITLENSVRLEKLESELAGITKKLKTIPAGKLVYAAATEFPGAGNFQPTHGKSREIRLLHRGDISNPGEVMLPAVPGLWQTQTDYFAANVTSEAHARANLARYLVSDENPLVWRSIVNRLWGWTLGNPLVQTQNDFGRGGMKPSHPELLNYLAARLRDDPQHSLKSILKLVLTSRAYRRSARIDPVTAKLDGGNQLLWRANRRRLTAEEFRDSVLLAAGVLDLTQGGPSFQDFVVEKPQHSPHYLYRLFEFDKQKTHRRTIYRFVVRSQPQPLLTTLDCADPSISIPARDESTTALQALATWNNRLVAYTALKLGERISAVEGSAEKRVEFACQEVLGRPPLEEEMQILLVHLREFGPSSLARVLFNMNAFLYVD